MSVLKDLGERVERLVAWARRDEEGLQQMGLRPTLAWVWSGEGASAAPHSALLACEKVELVKLVSELARDCAQLTGQLTAVQQRCTELLEERRRVDRRAQVTAFRRAMGGMFIGERPHVPPPEVARLQLSLVAEEFFELLVAAYGDSFALGKARDLVAVVVKRELRVDMVALADALADVDYVVEGTRVAFGIDGAPIAARVHEANMAKVGGPMREDGKRLKPPGWEPPDVEGCLLEQGWEPSSREAAQ
jgi:predicted HAD superfamily Cof-like phosphohydrolase